MQLIFPEMGDVVLMKTIDTQSVYAVQIVEYLDAGIYRGVYWYDKSISTRIHFNDIFVNMSKNIDDLKLV